MTDDTLSFTAVPNSHITVRRVIANGSRGVWSEEVLGNSAQEAKESRMPNIGLVALIANDIEAISEERLAKGGAEVEDEDTPTSHPRFSSAGVMFSRAGRVVSHDVQDRLSKTLTEAPMVRTPLRLQDTMVHPQGDWPCPTASVVRTISEVFCGVHP